MVRVLVVRGPVVLVRDEDAGPPFRLGQHLVELLADLRRRPPVGRLGYRRPAWERGGRWRWGDGWRHVLRQRACGGVRWTLWQAMAALGVSVSRSLRDRSLSGPMVR